MLEGRLIPFPLPEVLDEKMEAWEVVTTGVGLWAEAASVARKLVRLFVARDLQMGWDPAKRTLSGDSASRLHSGSARVHSLSRR